MQYKKFPAAYNLFVPARLRIFISSTMEDLANERDLVADRLQSFNFEPLNAEGILPSGAKSWDRICEEIDSCHLFVLLLGERYGWVPNKGPLANEKISVTHGEYRRARGQQIPVLTFKKTIPSDKDRPDDLSARQAFWKEVMEWDSGQFVSDFRLARDLAEKVAVSIVTVLSDEFQKTRISQRVNLAKVPVGLAKDRDEDRISGLREGPLPPGLVHAVQERRALLFAGSGISLAAGLPSADAFAAKLASAAGLPSHPVVGLGLASLATDVEIYGGGRSFLDKVIRPLFELGGRTSSRSHLQAVRLFDRIITTNYDDLFERAVQEANSGHEIIIASSDDRGHQADVLEKMNHDKRYLLKLHGTYLQPESLVINEDDLLKFGETHQASIKGAIFGMHNNTPIVVGSSLRDPTISKLFQDAHDFAAKPGYYVSPDIHPSTEARMKRLDLQPIRSSVESLLNMLEAQQLRQ